MSASGYRPDIQGLRALAVVVVVLYHARVPGFSGGFVGVDVFFVVSGFVIASSLEREILSTGTVSLRGFYARRVRRLLPAFATMAAVVTVATALLLPLGETQRAATSTAFAAAFSVANLQLLNSDIGYFSADDDLNPFLHTWSLGVEEQFYLLAPVTLVALLVAASRTRWGARTVVGCVLVATTISSFAYCHLALAAGADRSAFYHPLARFWEIGIGVLLAVASSREVRQRAVTNLLGGAAALTLALAVIVYDDSTRFPGLGAVPVVAATAVLIRVAPTSKLFEQVLSSQPATWIGDRSYGWYLWHWPFIVFASLWTTRPAFLLAAGVLSLVPTMLSYSWVEQPVRRASSSRKASVGLATAFALTASLSFAGVAGAERSWGIDAALELERTGIAYRRGCHGSEPEIPPVRCTFRASPSDRGLVLLLGDSHAASAADGVIEAANSLGYDVIVLSYCPVVHGIETHLGCEAYDRAIDTLLRSSNLKAVIVAHRSTRYVSPPVVAPNGEDQPLRDGAGRPLDHDVATALWAAGLAGLRHQLEAQGTPLMQIDVVPEFADAFATDITVVSPNPKPIVVSRDRVDLRRGSIVGSEHNALADGHSIDPADVLCDRDRCQATDASGRWLYFDDSHLNRSGALLLAPLIEAKLREIVQ